MGSVQGWGYYGMWVIKGHSGQQVIMGCGSQWGHWGSFWVIMDHYGLFWVGGYYGLWITVGSLGVMGYYGLWVTLGSLGVIPYGRCPRRRC